MFRFCFGFQGTTQRCKVFTQLSNLLVWSVGAPCFLSALHLMASKASALCRVRPLHTPGLVATGEVDHLADIHTGQICPAAYDIAAELWLRERLDTVEEVFQVVARNFTIRQPEKLAQYLCSLMRRAESIEKHFGFERFASKPLGPGPG